MIPPQHRDRRDRRRRWLLAILLLGVLGAVAIGVAARSAPRDRRATPYPTPAPVTFIPPTPRPATLRVTILSPGDPLIGRPVPDVTLATLDGGTIRLRDLAGQIVILNFWATWCAPCQDEMPVLQANQNEHGADGVRVIAVTDPDDGQTEADIRAFVDDLDLTLTVGLPLDHALAFRFAVEQIPTTFVIDRAGVVRYRHAGPLSAGDLAAYLARLDG